MSIYRSGQYSQIRGLQPVDANHNDDRREHQKKKSFYQGRAWTESEEDLPMQQIVPKEAKQERPAMGMYCDQLILERAKKYFDCLTTLEDRIAQLCFFEIEANYNEERQYQTELMIQKGELGGILFTNGDYKRQSYLIEHFQSLAKVPLLMGNDFEHGLSFYFQADLPLSFPEMEERRLSDLGKAVMVQNRKMGVHFQFDRQRSEKKFSLAEAQSRAFRKGIRDAHGIVGWERTVERKPFSLSSKKTIPPLSLLLGPLMTSVFGVDQVQDTVGVRTLNFLDFTRNDFIEELFIIDAFKSSHDAFLLSNNVATVIEKIAKAVRQGKIKEEELERRVMKILILKMLFFNR
jgi:hypothetical protein